MSLRIIRVLGLLGASAVWLQSPCAAQGPAGSTERTMKIAGAAGQTAFVLKITATDRWGKVEVRDEKGTQVQSLACPLVRENPAPTPGELAGVRELFVTRFEAKDLNADGHADLMGVREFGAKWARYCVWLYDPEQKLFAKDLVAEQMELLSNLTTGVAGWIVSYSIGPTNPWQAGYRVAGSGQGRPQHQLLPVYSCMMETAPDGNSTRAIVMTRYQSGQATVERRDVEKMEMSAAAKECGVEEAEKSHGAQPK